MDVDKVFQVEWRGRWGAQILAALAAVVAVSGAWEMAGEGRAARALFCLLPVAFGLASWGYASTINKRLSNLLLMVVWLFTETLFTFAGVREGERDERAAEVDGDELESRSGLPPRE